MLDEIGEWSEIKLAILKDYAPAYTKIVGSPDRRFHSVYVDAFAGPGLDVSRSTGLVISGSPVIALETRPRFNEYHFIDLDRTRVAFLADRAEGDRTIHIWEGDCNLILLDEIFPRLLYDEGPREFLISRKPGWIGGGEFTPGRRLFITDRRPCFQDLSWSRVSLMQ